MILDKRILNGKRPLTCLDLEEAREFKGKVCIFSDSYVNYKNILEYMKNPQYVGILELDNSEETEDYIFRNAHDGYKYCLALPLEWVYDLEPKYRPYKSTLEFFDDIGLSIGGIIHYRRKSDGTEYQSYIAGTSHEVNGVETVFFCNEYYTMRALFDYCEIATSDGWRPFGIKE